MSTYDPDLITKRLNRKVGRHKVFLHEGNWDIDSYENVDEYLNKRSERTTSVKLEDLEQRIQERGAAQVAKELEVSRATLFRKLKKARENGSDIVK